MWISLTSESTTRPPLSVSTRSTAPTMFGSTVAAFGEFVPPQPRPPPPLTRAPPPRALDVAGSRDRVRHRDRAPIRVGTRRRAGPAVDVLVRADQVAVAVGPVDDDLLDLDRLRRRNDVAFDAVEHDTVRAVDTSAF